MKVWSSAMSAFLGLFACDRPLRLGGVQFRIWDRGISVVVQAVADVVQAQRAGQVRIQHGHHMAAGAEGTCLNYVLAGKIFDDSVRFPSCYLRKNDHSMLLQIHGISCGCL